MTRLIKNISVLLLLLCVSLAVRAQRGGQAAFRQRNEARVMRPNVAKRFDQIKKNYIARQLNLTPEQSARFWPMYDAYQAELDEILILRRQNNTNVQPGGEDQFDRELTYQQRITAAQKKYYHEFCNVLPPDKAAQVFKSERDFKFELLRRLKEGHGPE
ncbi:hypothetical protein C8P68_105115 [Mucilaginibacter yixingensis]|uniref:LTXXQ motif family protein n=1 Tax=Mucilaginibacter yixingensis TaxID=1295612 RepID=A0A2T5J826_9SPHI|nr:hypothetical protein [Mucilaginibacter yixingensis]PTQ95610.1 hypothetical protein C8P68_105115 [Mucilaginibacter yixingensis]